MLIDLLNKNLIDSEDLLLKNYKKVGLNENQLVIVLLIIHLNSKSLTPNEISNYTNLSHEQVQKELEDLIQKKLIKVTSKTIDLSGLFIKIVQTLEQDLEIDENDLIKSLNKIFNTKLSVEDVNYLNSQVLPKTSNEEIISLAIQSNAKTWKEFKTELNKKIAKKVKPITKINWL